MIAPHHLGCSVEYCDFCLDKQGDIAFITVGNGPFFGWLRCESSECRRKCEAVRDEYTISFDALSKEFGTKFNVLRSSGEIQSGWSLASSAFWLYGSFHVKVQLLNGRNTIDKVVSLEQLRSWNTPGLVQVESSTE